MLSTIESIFLALNNTFFVEAKDQEQYLHQIQHSSAILLLKRSIIRNRSPAPHLCPFRPPQVQGVHLGGRNERIWGTSERLQLRVEGSLLPLVNGYDNS